ncbi:MAG: hypothetical protein KBC11_03180 [Candidatus Pacebacteria bacterium]|jgi:hypothetical protein|nr:hypothetical protein [Candidatus Paceibacterota bacterium]
MKKILLSVSVILSLVICSSSFAQETAVSKEIFLGPVSYDKNLKALIGSVLVDKHKDTDPIPLKEITVEAKILKTGTKEELLLLTPIKLSGGDGSFTFLIRQNILNTNTFYDAQISLKSTDGTNISKVYKFSTDKGIIPETGEARDNFFDKNSYRLLAPIPGMTALLDPALCQSEQYKNPGVICDINAFLNFLLSLAIGAAAVVLVVKIIISGYGYMTSDIPFVKARLKSGFVEALIGLVVALSAYLILNTINPRLVNNDVKVGVAEFSVKEYPELDSSTYQQITGKQILPKSQYVAMAQSIAKEFGIDECLLIATVTSESNWKVSAFGSDADFALDIPSRRAFINSGIKYSGATFTKGDSSKIKDKSFKNDTPKGKIDWRFSAGFGLLGITYFPEPYFKSGYESSVSYSLKDTVPELDSVWPKNPKTSKGYTPTELLDGETSLRLGASLLKKKSDQCKNPYTTLYSWNKGSCSNSSIGGDVRKRTYDQCKGIKN